ncbi:MAG TPA: CBS domain-containing protein [Steroidobacteraceae bacterium]|nr:CBS domain-containing protein [Steroidobacteraceae bacterium]
MNIGALCNRDLVCVTASTPLYEVARLMCERHVGAVVVTKSPLDQPVPVGVITDRDITRAQLDCGLDLSQLCSEEVMTPDPLVLCEDEAVEEGLGRMRARGVRRAPVATAHGTLVGVVSSDDLIAQFARELSSLARLLELQPIAEGLH